MAKVSGYLRHRGIRFTLASRWAMSAILVAGRGKGDNFCTSVFFFFFLFFVFHFHSCSSLKPVLFFISSTISSISFFSFYGRRH